MNPGDPDHKRTYGCAPPPQARADTALRNYYAARAPHYDTVYDKPERRADIAFLREYLPSRFAGLEVLEVACGTGYWTQFIAPAAKAMTSTDVTDEPLARAKTRPGTEKVRWRRADAYSLPASLGWFDAAFAGLWISHVPVQRRRAFVESLHRHLAPGSRVVFMDNSEVQCRELPIAERDEEGNTYQHRELPDGSVHRVLKNFPSPAELEDMTRDLGVHPHHRPLQNFWLFEYECASRD